MKEQVLRKGHDGYNFPVAGKVWVVVIKCVRTLNYRIDMDGTKD